jgi:hypothetical protein
VSSPSLASDLASTKKDLSMVESVTRGMAEEIASQTSDPFFVKPFVEKMDV